MKLFVRVAIYCAFDVVISSIILREGWRTNLLNPTICVRGAIKYFFLKRFPYSILFGLQDVQKDFDSEKIW